ncbi:MULTISPECIES: helix-turn-helix transcriptional regulator [unclassified Cellulophaga]|uniref:helix-turn-helix transcriptional regulator n=1 Tax=unclassified Cellulophaga TaxID=2634405 RepID=UPI0026E30F5C|nr:MULTISPECIES: WYL domain-containing protein [unclassified Cellulophaga]MDO6491333.1 WYL domain-containing protein [Cellulophaga sp. 2_MG-2023]MDO6495134.1 WYL domain-containing protein [Cellulophaga sp. 3_MG-2023]
MSVNKNALIRYKTIDKCLQNRYRKWTLESLISSCSDALYEYEGREINVSKRTVQLDIQMMRSDKLGYNAPIVVYDKKFYKYEDENFSITNIPLNKNDMNVLSETVEMLKQFKDFSLFSELGGIIQRLEDKVYSEKTQQSSIIHLDKNEKLKGLEFLDVLYQAILKKIVIKLTYQSFKAETPSVISFHPYILKEFNNRWFLVGRSSKYKQIVTFALDRIIDIDYNTSIEYILENFNGDKYYKDVIGVTVTNKRAERIQFWVDKKNAPYVETKPFHKSQRIIEKKDDGVIFNIFVKINFELERIILGFGDSIEVIKPKNLRDRIHTKLQNANKLYKKRN